MLAAPPPATYASVMHRKRVMGDKVADDAARAAAFSRGNRIKLSQVMRQFPSAHDGRKIRCTAFCIQQRSQLILFASAVEKCVTDIDALPERCRGIEILFLSHNMISSLDGIQQFSHLRILSLTANPISDIEQLRHLSGIVSLQSVSFEDCDITLQPYYRSYVIKLLPQLRVLDSKEIKDAERDVAAPIVSRCEETLQVMFTTHFLILKLSRVVTRIRLHSDLICAVFGRISVLNRLDMATSWNISTKKLLQYWEVESLVSPEEVSAVYRSLRSEIVRQRNILARKSAGPAPKNAFDVFKAITSDKSVSKLSDSEMWDAAIKETMAAQQGRVSILLGDIDTAKADAERSSSTIFKQVQRINSLREAQLKSEAAHKNDRENVIIELRQELERVSEGGPAPPPHKNPLSSVKPASARRPVMAERNSHMQLQTSVSRVNEAPKSAKKRPQHQSMSPDGSSTMHSTNPNTPFAMRQLSPDFVIERVPPTEPRHSSSSSSRTAARGINRSASRKAVGGSRSGPSDDEEQPLTPPEMFSMQLPPTPPTIVSGGIDDSIGDANGDVSEGESLLPPPPRPLSMDGNADASHSMAGTLGSAKVAKDRSSRMRVDRPPQLKPADTIEGLKQQVLLLQRDIDLRVEEEARLQDVISEFTQRTLEMQSINNRNVDAAEAETKLLAQQLQEAKAASSVWEARARDGDVKLRHIIEGSGSSELQAFKLQEQQLEILRSENAALRSDVQKLAADSVKVHAQAEEYSHELQRLWASSAVADKADELREALGLRRRVRAIFKQWSVFVKLKNKGRLLQAKLHRNPAQLHRTITLFRLRCVQSRALVQVASRVHSALKFRVIRLWCQLLAASKIGRTVRSRGAAAAAVLLWRSAAAKRAKTRRLVQRSCTAVFARLRERLFASWRGLTFPSAHAASALAGRLQRASSHHVHSQKKRFICRWRHSVSFLNSRRRSPLILHICRRSSFRRLASAFAKWLQLRAATSRLEGLVARLHCSNRSRRVCLPVLRMWHRLACSPVTKVTAALWFEKARMLKLRMRCWGLWAAARLRGARVRQVIEVRSDTTARVAIAQWRSSALLLARSRIMEQKAVKHHAFRMIRTGIVVVKFWKKAVGRARFVSTMASHFWQRHCMRSQLRYFLFWSRSFCRSLSARLRDAAASSIEAAESLEQHVQKLSHADVENLELVDRLHQAASDNTALQRRVKDGEQAASEYRRALEDASIIEQSLRSELERARITAGDAARRISATEGSSAALADPSHVTARVATDGEWSLHHGSSGPRRHHMFPAPSASRLPPPPLPPFFDSTLNTSNSDSSVAHTPAPLLPRYSSPAPSFSGVAPPARHSAESTPSSALGWAVADSSGTPSYSAAVPSAAIAAVTASCGEAAGQKELRNEIANLQSRILARLSNH